MSSAYRRANGDTYSQMPYWDCNVYEPQMEDFGDEGSAVWVRYDFETNWTVR